MTYRLRSPLLGSLGLLGLLAVHARAQVSTVHQLDCRKPLTLDVATRSVVGIPLDVSDSALEASLPPRSLERQVHVDDGDTVTTYTIALCGHVLTLGWNGVSTMDPAFVTTEGLHVGQPITRFDEAWGIGQLLWSEAGYVMYYFFKRVSINTGVEGCVILPRAGAQPTVRRDCPVASLWVSTGERASRAR